jgi:hypothetical protein
LLSTEIAFAQDDHRRRGIRVFFDGECTSPRRLHAEGVEVAARHQTVLLVADAAVEGRIEARPTDGRRDRRAPADVIAKEPNVAVRGVAEAVSRGPRPIVMSRSEVGYGRGRRSTALTGVNTASDAPRPRPSVRIAASASAGCRSVCRTANMRSCTTDPFDEAAPGQGTLSTVY